MAKLPKYIQYKGFNYENKTIVYTIKRWGIPHLFYKTLKERFELTPLQWLIFYPYVCIKAMFGRKGG